MLQMNNPWRYSSWRFKMRHRSSEGRSHLSWLIGWACWTFLSSWRLRPAFWSLPCLGMRVSGLSSHSPSFMVFFPAQVILEIPVLHAGRSRSTFSPIPIWSHDGCAFSEYTGAWVSNPGTKSQSFWCQPILKPQNGPCLLSHLFRIFDGYSYFRRVPRQRVSLVQAHHLQQCMFPFAFLNTL